MRIDRHRSAGEGDLGVADRRVLVEIGEYRQRARPALGPGVP
jgi:hypothetical protein